MDITSISLSNEGVVFMTPENTEVINNILVLNEYFGSLSKKGIKKMSRTKNKAYSSIIFNDGTRVIINDFNKIRKKSFCKELNKQITIFKLKTVARKLNGKKLIVIGSVVGLASISVQNYSNENEVIMSTNEIENNTSSNTNTDYVTFGTINIEDKSDSNDFAKPEKTNRIFAQERDYSNNNINEELDIDPLSLIEEEVEEVTKDNTTNNESTAQVKKQDELNIDQLSQNISPNNQINFDDLKNFTSYDEYINLAANLYGVNIDKAYEIVKANYQNYTTPGKQVNESYAQEIDRMKDLTNRGFINGDLNVIGIFLTIKDYALDNLNLSNQPAIHSEKTQEEREKDIINIAKYIYGIDDSYLLSMLIATTRVESANFTSPATINKNNIGGNMSTAGTFEHPILNTYKTAEIGEESFVRNFLNCYGKSLVAHNYDRSLPIPYIMKDKFCPHTPNEWESVITEKTAAIQESSLIDEYLDNSSKSI